MLRDEIAIRWEEGMHLRRLYIRTEQRCFMLLLDKWKVWPSPRFAVFDTFVIREGRQAVRGELGSVI
jgi:hypothetical protein